ncbi:hypothetical protein GQR58_009596 [Nymphon striatum]|nr:hypothetical protein GQR58_009596 [Nymphon striatum]
MVTKVIININKIIVIIIKKIVDYNGRKPWTLGLFLRMGYIGTLGVYPFDVNFVKVESCDDSPFAVGDEVWIKPPIPSCTKQWSLGMVSGVMSKYVVRVDGMPRHVKDIRKRRYGSNRGVVHGDRVDTAGPVEPAGLSGGDASYADSTFWRTGAPYQSAPTPGRSEQFGARGSRGQPVDGDAPSAEPATPAAEGGDTTVGTQERSDGADQSEQVPLRRSQRERRRPTYLDDYLCDS